MVRFRNGTPAQRINSNLSNRAWEPFREPIGPDPSHDTAQATQSHAEHQSASGPRSYVVWAAL